MLRSSNARLLESAPKESFMTFKFIDLFAGIGGFHAAMSGFGGKCVYAVEIDEEAAAVYERNWGISTLGDITVDATDETMNVPDHDVLCAGFPCQPFSKSGAQRGMEETRGTLYWNILNIIRVRKPALVLLENVRNLAGPRHRHEWQVIIETLRDEGYVVSDIPAVFSPHLLPPERGGRPQIRERVFIVAVLGADPADACQAVITPPVECRPVGGWDPQTWDLEDDLLDPVPDIPGCELSDAEIHWIEAWNDFVVGMWEEREGRRLPGFPLWGNDWVHRDELSIPPKTPKWKYNFLRKNAEFYTEHQEFIDDWSEKWEFHTDKFPPSRRKFEWQAQDTPDLWSTVMHLRPSGIRAKRPTYLPALVAITQTSIIGPLRRRLSPREAARLQGLPDWFDFGDQPTSATYKQLGNAVSVGAVWHVTREAARLHEETLKKVAPKLAHCILESDESPDKAMLTLGHC